MFSIRLVFAVLIVCFLAGCSDKMSRKEFDEALQRQRAEDQERERKLKEEVKRARDEAIREREENDRKIQQAIDDRWRKLMADKEKEKTPAEVPKKKEPSEPLKKGMIEGMLEVLGELARRAPKPAPKNPYLVQKEREVDAILAVHEAYFNGWLAECRVGSNHYGSNYAYQQHLARKRNAPIIWYSDNMPKSMENYFAGPHGAAVNYQKGNFNKWEKERRAEFAELQTALRAQLMALSSYEAVRLGFTPEYVQRAICYVESRRRMGLPP